MKNIRYISLMFLLLAGLASSSAQVVYSQERVSQPAFGQGASAPFGTGAAWGNTNSRNTYFPLQGTAGEQKMNINSRYSAQMSDIGASLPRNRYRKAMDDDPFGGGTIDDTPNPLEPGTPIGDAPWWLIAALAMLWLIKKTKINRTTK